MDEEAQRSSCAIAQLGSNRSHLFNHPACLQSFSASLIHLFDEHLRRFRWFRGFPNPETLYAETLYAETLYPETPDLAPASRVGKACKRVGKALRIRCKSAGQVIGRFRCTKHIHCAEVAKAIGCRACAWCCVRATV